MNDEMMMLEERMAAMEQRLEAMSSIGPIVATVENGRELELERRLAEVETEVASLRAAAAHAPATVTNGRKTLPAGMMNLLAKQGVAVDSLEAGALDAALVSLSIEQRMAVKAQLIRSGMVG